MSAAATQNLSAEHNSRLEKAGISTEYITALDYKTANTKAEVERLGFAGNQYPAPALVIPIHNAKGEHAGVQIRADSPRMNREGKPIKYELPKGSKVTIDVPPQVRMQVLNGKTPLVITDGPIKADAGSAKGVVVVTKMGVAGWWDDDPFWHVVLLKDRQCLIVFESDIATNENVKRAAKRLAGKLKPSNARLEILILPPSEGGGKQDLDDCLTGKGSVEDLISLPHLDLSESVQVIEQTHTSTCNRRTLSRLFVDMQTGSEVVSIPLTNFDARITADVQIDNGSTTCHEFEIKVKLHGELTQHMVLAEDFEKMAWVVPLLGARAIIHAGVITRNHTRAAIQAVSGNNPKRKVIKHLGWRKFGQVWSFCHAGGIRRPVLEGEDRSYDDLWDSGLCSENKVNTGTGPVCSITPEQELFRDLRVRVPELLSAYRLPLPPDAQLLKQERRSLLGQLKKLRRKLRMQFSPWGKQSLVPERIQADLPQEPKEPRPARPEPLALAHFYRSLIDSGICENRAAIARPLGVSCARVTQVLRRLKSPDQFASNDSTEQEGDHHG